MESISFEQVTEETLYIALEMVNSNPEYNLIKVGKETRTIEDVKEAFIQERTKSICIKLDDTYIGLINYSPLHSIDQCPWLNEFLIHKDYQGYGFGSKAHDLFENQLATSKIRSGVFKEHTVGKDFLEARGYTVIDSLNNQGREMNVFEKKLSDF